MQLVEPVHLVLKQRFKKTLKKDFVACSRNLVHLVVEDVVLVFEANCHVKGSIKLRRHVSELILFFKEVFDKELGT